MLGTGFVKPRRWHLSFASPDRVETAIRHRSCVRLRRNSLSISSGRLCLATLGNREAETICCLRHVSVDRGVSLAFRGLDCPRTPQTQERSLIWLGAFHRAEANRQHAQPIPWAATATAPGIRVPWWNRPQSHHQMLRPPGRKCWSKPDARAAEVISALDRRRRSVLRVVGSTSAKCSGRAAKPVRRTWRVMRYVGKVAIVTGGGNGIGRATALRLASEGAAAGGLRI